jgi:tetratricopeptide (TPR) repeat protein
MKLRLAMMSVLLVLFLSAAYSADKTPDIPVTTNSQEARALFQQGLHYLDVGRAIESKESLQKAIEKDPQFAHAYFYLSMTAFSPEEFKATVDKGLQNASEKSDGEKTLLQLQQTFVTNDAAKRMELAKSLIAEYPNGPRAWMRLGFTQAAVNQHEESRKSWNKALQLDPKLVGAHYALMFSYVFNEPKNFDAAQKEAEQCIALEPKEAKAYEGLGDVYRAKNELEKARDAYARAIQVDPALSVASLKKAHVNSFLGNFDEARADYDKGIAATEDINKIGYANFKAFTYVHAGQPQVALDELQKLVSSADSMRMSKDQARAQKLATLNNEFTIAIYNKMIPKGEDILKQITDLTKETISGVKDPDFARQQQAGLLLLDAQLAAAKSDYQAARNKAEENKKMLEQNTNPRKLEGYYAALGMTERLQGNFAKAVEDFRKSDLTVLFNKYQLGLSLQGAGNSQESKKVLREVAQYNFNTVDFALVRKDAIKRSA